MLFFRFFYLIDCSLHVAEADIADGDGRHELLDFAAYRHEYDFEAKSEYTL